MGEAGLRSAPKALDPLERGRATATATSQNALDPLPNDEPEKNEPSQNDRDPHLRATQKGRAHI
ncbi:MAG: hypothetical protein V5A18_07780, partial [Haloarculaceae archaeon]